ncbi:phosphohydrolase [Agrobacterium vitis]|uniref:phosphohydrolase n=1 Tax=Agrobacterium vitis TaxID=373 RepID=UPI0018D1FE55|nr:phosphohydrolase [Agrobacterium vitis]
MENTEVIAQGEDRRHGDWMQTYSGRKFWPCDPRPDEIHIEDIAHALSMACRYGGHCNQFYSVAEHSILISHQVRSEDALWGLLHDAAEAYISDIIRPIKPYLNNYKTFETNLMTAICIRFGLPLVTPESVRWADEAILGDELNQVMGKPPEPWGLRYRPIGVTIRGLPPRRAEKEFLERFYELAPHECGGSLACALMATEEAVRDCGHDGGPLTETHDCIGSAYTRPTAAEGGTNG